MWNVVYRIFHAWGPKAHSSKLETDINKNELTFLTIHMYNNLLKIRLKLLEFRENLTNVTSIFFSDQNHYVLIFYISRRKVLRAKSFT